MATRGAACDALQSLCQALARNAARFKKAVAVGVALGTKWLVLPSAEGVL